MPKPHLLSAAITTLAATLLITGCSSTSNETALTAQTGLPATKHAENKITTFYDYQLYTPQQQPISLSNWAKSALKADVILIGEWHTHSGIHRFQTDALKQLLTSDKPIALSMEQFSRDSQQVLDQYLKGEVGEQVLIQQGNAWPNYESDYRPLIELAKASNTDVIAANAPRPVIRCISQQGLEYLDKLNTGERATVASDIDLSDSPYKQKFMSSMHHGQPTQQLNMYASQLTWDATMAESIVQYLTQHSGSTVVHIAGKFHTEGGLGTAAQIKRLNPDLKIVIVTPVETLISGSDDYQLQVLAPPMRYVKQENQLAAYKKMSHTAKPAECQ